MFEFDSMLQSTLDYVVVVYDCDEGDYIDGTPDEYDITIVDLDGKDITDTISIHDLIYIEKEVKKHYEQICKSPCE